jgi:hypothetical protein
MIQTIIGVGSEDITKNLPSSDQAGLLSAIPNIRDFIATEG